MKLVLTASSYCCGHLIPGDIHCHKDMREEVGNLPTSQGSSLVPLLYAVGVKQQGM